MINLLPLEEKRQLRAARTNTLLLRYNIFLVIALAFLGVAVAITYLYLTSAKASAEQTINQNTNRVGEYASVEAQAQLFRSNLATAKQILDREVVYTSIIVKIAELLPSGVVLDSLNLDSETFDTETTLVARAKNYNDALALKESFQKSPLFSNVHFQNIITDDTQNAYPVTVNINVTINKEAVQ